MIIKDGSSPTIVILSANAGSGHRKAGDSLKTCLVSLKPGWQVRHENVGDYVGPVRAWVIERCWEFLSTTPAVSLLYSRAYRFLVTSVLARKLFERALTVATRSLQSRFKAVDIRMVVAVHPAAVIAASQWRKSRFFTLHAVCTDLIVHGLHDVDGVDRIFCDRRSIMLLATDRFSVRGRLTYSGLPTSGIRYSPTDMRSMLEDFDVLVTFGTKGFLARRHMNTILRCLKAKGLSGIVVCGSNTRLRFYVLRRIQELHLGRQVACRGFVSDLGPFLQAAKVIIGKPGGITVGEALSANRHFIVIDQLPGQEEFNRDALINSGLGLACKHVGLSDCLDRALAEFRSQSIVQLQNVSQMGSPHIAAVIAADIDGHFNSSSAQIKIRGTI